MTGRVDPPFSGDERTTLVAFLDYYRETMCMLVDGLDDERSRWAPTPGANSILGMLSHLRWVETWWFQECFAGGSVERPWDPKAEPDGDFSVPAERSIADVVEEYRTAWRLSNEITAAASLDDAAAHPRVQERGFTLRWILVHMIEETARHAGHADITRELIDGTTGI